MPDEQPKGKTKKQSKGKGQAGQSAWSSGPPKLSSTPPSQPKQDASSLDSAEGAKSSTVSSPPGLSGGGPSGAATETHVESAEMKATKEQLEMKEKYLESLKPLTSDSAVAERQIVAGLILDLQHRINALKAPKDRVPG